MTSQETWSLPSYGITFNTGVPDETGCRYMILKDQGWRGGAAPRNNRDPKAAASGEHRRTPYLDGLKVTWTGEFYAPNAASRAAGERKLRRIGKDTKALFEVRCSDSLGELFSFMEIDSATLVEPNSLIDGDFSMQFASPDPRQYTVSQTSGGTTGLASSTGGLDWVTGGGLDWVTGGGLNWGTVTSTGQFTFNNTGDAETDPVFTITLSSGTLVNPTITVSSTGQRLHYNGVLQANDVVRIDTSEFTRSAVLNGGTDVRVRLDVAEWFQLPPGLTTVNFSADVANATATLTGAAFNAYW